MAWTLQLTDDSYLDLTTPIAYDANITLTVNVVIDTLDATRRSIVSNAQATSDFSNNRFFLGLDENDKFIFSTGSTGRNKVFSGTVVTGQEYELKVELVNIPATATYGGTETFKVDGVSYGSGTVRGEVWANGHPPRYLGCHPSWVGSGTRGGMLGKIVSASVVAGAYSYTWSPESSDRSNTGSMPVLVDTVVANDWIGTGGFSTDGSDWVQFGASAEVTVDQANIEPGGVLSGTYSNFTAGTPPTSPISISDGTNTITVPVVISDNGDGTGTYTTVGAGTGAVPVLPSVGTSISFVLFGNVTVTLDDA